MEIKRILGTAYLCSKFVNHDGTLVSDHPLYIFETDVPNIALAVMFTSKTNPFTTHWRDGNDLKFICCSDHIGEIPSMKVFQAEIYLVNMADKNLKYSEYRFQNFLFNADLLKALKNALKEGLSTGCEYGIKSVHSYDVKDDVSDKEEIMKSLLAFIEPIVSACAYAKNCPEYGPVNTTYDEVKKIRNEYSVKYNNQKVFDQRYKK